MYGITFSDEFLNECNEYFGNNWNENVDILELVVQN